ncbi:MAG: LPS biosynthesis protein WbpP [Euryarchaeota archaeon]|nr:LPS biosynthesis protein WbpP [Euryarchaeota archaeon]|tara:strand:- start:3262 stop:4245 length:984 start_codon:yes stop_codon:yes gene_type:complete
MSELSNCKILVTGGAGFIGSHICDKLLEKGAEVVCLDNFITGHLRNIEHNQSNPKFKLIEGDIRDIETCKKAMIGCTHVCHQAALGSVPRSVKDPLTTNEINITGTLNIFFSAYEAGIKRIVFASSSSCYGDEPNLPKVESKIGIPLSPYAITKFSGELYARIFNSLYGMEMIGLRYFNVFGPRQDPEGMYAAVIPKFVQSLIKEKSPEINGDGSYSRDFTFIENVVEMNILALTTTSKEATGLNYNVACGQRLTILDLFLEIRLLLTDFNLSIAKIKPIHVDPRPGDIPHSLASIDLAKDLIGYNPKIMPKEGLSLAIKWYWENLQ